MVWVWGEDLMEIDLNTADTDEYREWLALLNELSQIQAVLRDNPNKKGLKIARSHAYNLLADIQILLDHSYGVLKTDASNDAAQNTTEVEDMHLVDRRAQAEAG